MSTKIISFIDSNYLKTNSPISKHIDDELISPILIQSQEKWIIPILGSNLYNDLQTQIYDYITSGSTIDANYVTLINEYIKPTHLNYSMYELIPFINYKITNISVSKKNSEFSQASEVPEMNYIRNSIKSTAQFYSDRLSDYLKINYQLYPKFYINTNNNQIYPQKSDINCGIYL
jgi:hypothetical protein